MDGNISEALIPKGSRVKTPYGFGSVESYRETDSVYKVKLNWQMTVKKIGEDLKPNSAWAYLHSSLVEWKKKLFEMNTRERIKQALDHKDEGKEFFIKNDLMEAIKKYNLSLVYLQQIENPTEEEESERKDIMVTCHNNISLCRIKLGQCSFAADEATDCLKINPKNVKALYYRARANRERGELKKALSDLVTAYKLESKNSKVREELTLVRKKLKQASISEKKNFEKLFASSKNKSTPKAPTTSPKKQLETKSLNESKTEIIDNEKQNVQPGQEETLPMSVAEKWSGSQYLGIGLLVASSAIVTFWLLRRSSTL